MSEIQRFTKDLNENKEMQEEVKGLGNDMEKVVAYANSKGYEFTVADVENLAQQSEELSDEELEKVSGGYGSFKPYQQSPWAWIKEKI